jgi:hypothetical protein
MTHARTRSLTHLPAYYYTLYVAYCTPMCRAPCTLRSPEHTYYTHIPHTYSAAAAGGGAAATARSTSTRPACTAAPRAEGNATDGGVAPRAASPPRAASLPGARHADRLQERSSPAGAGRDQAAAAASEAAAAAPPQCASLPSSSDSSRKRRCWQSAVAQWAHRRPRS